MNHIDPKRHWEDVYGSKAENEVSWFQDEPATSIEFIRHCGGGVDVPIIDIGGGESRLVDRLLDAGYSNVTVLDLSEHALRHTKERLGERAQAVNGSSPTSPAGKHRCAINYGTTARCCISSPNRRIAMPIGERFLTPSRPAGVS
jgi:hypothetical protein